MPPTIMSLNLNKPLRIKGTKEAVEFVKKLDKTEGYPICVIREYSGRGKHFWVCSEYELENIPQSRWLNVWIGLVSPLYKETRTEWHPSREAADLVAKRTKHVGDKERIAVIEDKQDGSDWIVHKLEVE